MHFVNYCLHNEYARRLSRILIGLMRENMLVQDPTWDSDTEDILGRGGFRFIGMNTVLAARLELALWARLAFEVGDDVDLDQIKMAPRFPQEEHLRKSLVELAVSVKEQEPAFDDDWSVMAVLFSTVNGRRGVQRGLRMQILWEWLEDLLGAPLPDYNQIIHDPSDPNDPDMRAFGPRDMGAIVPHLIHEIAEGIAGIFLVTEENQFITTVDNRKIALEHSP